jgi:hypothetical protein
VTLALALLGWLTVLFLGTDWTAAQVATQCEFRLGFKLLHDSIPEVVGGCLENEHHNPLNGDALQRTSGGLLVWRKSDNWTAFTNGSRTWINGPEGLQSRLNDARFGWETPPAPAVPPEAERVLEQAVVEAARRSGLDRSAVRVVQLEPREWSDASLGCPQPDRMYAQVITPGYLIVLEAGGQRLEFHTDANSRVVSC